MIPRSLTRLALPSMLALLLATAAPLAAQEAPAADPTLNLGLANLYAAGELRLDLRKTLEAGRPSFGLYGTATAASSATPAMPAANVRTNLSQAGREAAQVAWRAVERTELMSDRLTSRMRSRGFGKWLKKHWYVPVIVGVAVGVTIADDDDSGEVDDD